MRVQLKRFGNRITILCGIAMGVVVESQVIAQAQRLPPPPNIPVTPVPSSPLPSLPSTPPGAVIDGIQNERVYTAPRVSPVQPVSGGYRVFVDSDSPFVLQQVRSIQPDAFIQNFGGRRVIQAGLFRDEFNARQQVSRLAAQGIDAQITGRSPQPGFGDSARRRGYYAIVPGNRIEVQAYRDRAIRLGVSQSLMQIRDRPRGTHLAVGPYADQRQAERIVQYLRDRGSLDARLFYAR